ncbi:acyl-[ACP]--phospholipid O-acyltransferase [Maricurvus nonylphenolicus]|uniref:MFS transporter n=1 Tax=Maricurvus nonylphenolicus TaxID=1008307 RepID=UPI0036F3DD56
MPRLSAFSGFLPYIAIVFLNAFVDLGHKIVVQNTVFKVYDGNTQVILTAIVNALILLPFILLFSPAGFLSDKYPKHKVMRYSAWAAVAATLLITACYYAGWFWGAFALTLALAIQSALYSPAKYGYIKELVGKEPLARANGAVQATTITGILLGTFVFSGLFEWLLQAVEPNDTSEIITTIAPIGWILVGLSVIELILCYRLPSKSITHRQQHFSVQRYARLDYLKTNLRALKKQPAIWQSIIGLATFWAISQVVLAAFPAFAKETLNETNTLVIQGILACTGVGIIIGSMLAGRLSRNYIELGLIPVGSLGITLILALVPTLDSSFMLGLCFLGLGIMGGLFIIPLNALIQFNADESELGTILAGNNWIQNVTMLAFLGLTVCVSLLELSTQALLALLAVVALLGTGYTVRKLSHACARIVVGFLFKGRYRIDVSGFKNLPAEGGVLLLGNHISWIDWALVQIACPRPVRFVMQREIYNRRFIRPIMKLFGVIPIAKGHSEDALQTINQLLRQGEVVCLFPEGAISRTGQLGKFHTGFERAAEGLSSSDAVIVPFYLRGLWGSKFSRATERLREQRNPKGIRRELLVAFGPQLAINTQAAELKQRVFELSISAWEEHTEQMDNIPLAWIKTAKRQANQWAAKDSRGERFTYRRLLSATLMTAANMRRKERSLNDNHLNIGILLPVSSANMVTNMAVMLNGHAVVNLNPHMGTTIEQRQASLLTMLNDANIDTIYTSASMLAELQAQGLNVESIFATRQVIDIAELTKGNNPSRKRFYRFISRWLPASVLYRLCGRQRNVNDPAAILFTERKDKPNRGVLLSHRNIVANCRQLSDVLNTQDSDVMIGYQAPYHAYGFTSAILLPMLEGLPVICCPDSQDTQTFAKTIARQHGTVLCADAELLQTLINDNTVGPLMLSSLRLVVCGGTPLPAATQAAFENKFHRAVYQGYGCTEATPVVSVNLPDALDTQYWRIQVGNKPGSVGLPLPGTSCKIVDADTLLEKTPGEAGEILISGAQVMLGYLNSQNHCNETANEVSKEIVTLNDKRRWFRTGDRGYIDSEGFLTLTT